MSIKESFGTFTGQEPVSNWITNVDIISSVKKMGEEERLIFALQHVSDDVRDCITSLARSLEELTEKTWSWDWVKLKVALRAVEDQLKEKGPSNEDMLAKARNVAVITGAACISGPVLLTTGLGAIGFSAIGPVAGSIAALVQSTVYGGAVGAGSLFAFCQSLTMGSAGSLTLASGLSGAGAATTATIREIMKKPPSKSWKDGAAFRPSIKVTNALNALMVSRSNLSEKE